MLLTERFLAWSGCQQISSLFFVCGFDGIVKPDFAKETGFRPPQKKFIDGVIYDGSQPNAYLKQFSIGLKSSDKL